MGNIFDPDGKLMELLWKPIHIMFLNLLWVLFSLPFVTIGASTTALYSVLIKMRNGREGKILRDFWTAFRQNFRQATILWLLIVLAAFVFTTDIVFFLNMGGSFGTFSAMLFVGLDVLLLLVSLYVFPMQAVFDNPIGRTVKSALLLLSRHLGWTVVLLALAILTAVAVILYWPLIGWFVFGLAAFINAWIFDKIFRRYYPKEEQNQQE